MGLSDVKRSYTPEVIKPNDVMKKKLGLTTLDTSVRPITDSVDYRNRSAYRWSVSRYGFNYITQYDLWALAQYADILQIIFNARGREAFRNGYKISPKSPEASKGQRAKIDALFRRANNNNQSLTEVFKELLKDADWADDLFLLVSKDYTINDRGEVTGGKIDEVLRLNPLSVELVVDRANRLGYYETSDGQSETQRAYFDLRTRSLTPDPIDKDTGVQNLRAHYRVRTEDGFKYYNDTEILHKSLHNPSLTYGFSPLYSLYPKVLILITQDDFIRKYYGENKPPKGMIVFNTDNTHGLSKVFDEVRQKSKQNPHEIYPIPFNNKTGGKAVEYVDMSRSLDEMQYTESRNENRNQVGAAYGVSPIFQNDMSTSGGLNNEGLQITVTNRAIEDVQFLFNDSIIPFIFQLNMNITDWTIALNPSEEEDQAFKLELEEKELANIKTRLEMGQEIEQDKNGKFIIQEGKLKLEKTESEFVPFQMSEDKKEVEVTTPVVVKNITKQKPAFPKKEEKQFETALQKELKKILKELDLKKRPTEKQLKNTVDSLSKNLERQLKAKSANRIKAIYNKSVKQVGKELGEKLTLTGKDRNAIEALKRQPELEKSFSGMSKQLSKNLKKVIDEAYDDPEKFTIDKLVKNMEDVGEGFNNRLRTIARTESSKINLAARKISYQKSPDFDKAIFKVIGIDDSRTGEDSKEIKKLVGKGKTWKEVVDIIQTVAGPRWKVDPDAPIPRPNWRHSIVKVV